jgi:hypothetical protein
MYPVPSTYPSGVTHLCFLWSVVLGTGGAPVWIELNQEVRQRLEALKATDAVKGRRHESIRQLNRLIIKHNRVCPPLLQMAQYQEE